MKTRGSGSKISTWRAINGGCDGICVARAPVSGGTSQPDLIAMWNALKGTEYTLDIDISKILEANSVFKERMSEYYFPPEALRVSSRSAAFTDARRSSYGEYYDDERYGHSRSLPEGDRGDERMRCQGRIRNFRNSRFSVFISSRPTLNVNSGSVEENCRRLRKHGAWLLRPHSRGSRPGGRCDSGRAARQASLRRQSS